MKFIYPDMSHELTVSKGFLTQVTDQMNGVLADCIKKQKDCSCSIAIKYLPDKPKNQRVKLVVYCADNDNQKFVAKTDELLISATSQCPPVQLVEKKAT